MIQRALVAIVSFAIGSGVARGDDAPSEASKNLQGEWRAIILEIGGMKASEEDAKAFRMSVKGDVISLMTCKGDRCIERKKTFKLDPAKSPREIDFIALDGLEKGMIQPCIYSMDEGQLRLCVPLFADGSAKRPAEFKSRAGDGLMVLVLERVKAQK